MTTPASGRLPHGAPDPELPEGWVSYNGIDMPVAKVPDATIRAYLGFGHFSGYGRYGRSVIDVPGRVWPHTPDTCLTDEYVGEWVNPTTLVCTGCGLDCT